MDLFLKACGANGPLRLSVEYQNRPEPVQCVLNQPYALVGRDARADVVLSEGQASRHHAYLQQIAGRIFCVDLDSRTGTHWERGAKRTGWLDNGQAIRIGSNWVRYLSGLRPGESVPGEAAGQSPAQPQAQNGLPEVMLEFINRADRPQIWRMVPLLALVGKASECRVRLVGQSVANYHCGIVRTPLGVWVVDLLGPGGVLVQDTRVRCARLEDGDRLQVGRFLMRIHYESALPALPASSDQQPHLLPAEQTADSAGLFQAEDLSADLDPGEEPLPSPALLRTSSFPKAFPRESSLAAGHDLVMVPSAQGGADGDVPQNMIVPIVQQFGLMQQQMFDQFQQSMMMMFQMFTTVHRDQIGVIREEMDRLQELTTEVQSLQTELARMSTAKQAQTPGFHPPARPAQVTTGPAPKPMAQPASAMRPQPVADQVRQPAAGFHPPSPAPVATNGAESKSPEMPLGQSQADVHAWLSRRIVEIQHERQTRWQRVVSFLTGKENGH